MPLNMRDYQSKYCWNVLQNIDLQKLYIIIDQLIIKTKCDIKKFTYDRRNNKI